MSNDGAARRAAVPGRAKCPRRGQPQERRKSRGPKTPEGKARAAQNALKHGMRAQKYVLLPQEDAAAFAALETAILAELAPEGVLQILLARRVAVAAWRLERADRMEAEVLEFRSYEDANAGLALIRDGNATRSFDTLMRYRSAAMAEFWRALKTLKALQAEHAAGAQVLEMPPRQPRAPRGSRPVLRRTNPSAGRCTITSSPTGPARPHPPRARSALDAERTRARSGSERSSGEVRRTHRADEWTTAAGAQPTSSRPQLAAWSMRTATTGRLSMRMAASWG